MEITPMVSMAAESTDTERAQTIASQLVHCAQHASAVESERRVGHEMAFKQSVELELSA